MHALAPILGLTTLVSLPLLAQPIPQEPVQEPVQEPAVEIVSLGSGTVVAAKGIEYRVWPRSYSGQMILKDVAEHGSWVEKGQPMARLDRRSLEKQLEAAEIAEEQAEIALRAAHERAEMQTESLEWGLHRKELALERAAQELESWEEFERGQAEANQRLSAMYRKHGLEDALDELMQLEAMYTDDELTDATEEIVLKRSRRNLERSRISAELQERQAAHTRETDWKRTSMMRRVALEEAEMAMHHAQREAEMSMRSLESGMQSAERALRDARQRLEDLHHDAEMLAMMAPARGVLLHGSLHQGGTSRHNEGGQLAPRQVAFSIIQPGKYAVKMHLSAELITQCSNGQSVEVKFGETTLSGSLEFDRYAGPGGYAARIELDGEQAQLAVGDSVSVSFRKG